MADQESRNQAYHGPTQMGEDINATRNAAQDENDYEP